MVAVRVEADEAEVLPLVVPSRGALRVAYSISGGLFHK